LPLENFFLDYGKQDGRRANSSVCACPKFGPDERFRCYKISKRFDSDISPSWARSAAPRWCAYRGGAHRFGGMAAIPSGRA